MSIMYNLDGSVTFYSDADGTIQQEGSGKTAAQIATDYAAFKNTWPFAWCQTNQLVALLFYLQNYLNLSNFVDGGSASTTTGTAVANFLSSLTNNYRTKKAALLAATTSAQVWAVDFTTGWPANP